MLVHLRGHFVVQGGHDLLGHLHDRDKDATVMKVFRHLQSDEAGSDNKSLPHVFAFDILLDPVSIRDIAHREDTLQIDSRDRWFDRLGAGGEDQLVVALPVGFPGIQVCHSHSFFFDIETSDFRADPNVDLEAGGKALRSLDEQLFPIGDHSADVVG